MQELNETTTFPPKWAVQVDSQIPPLCVKVPALTLEALNVQFSSVPEFLRLDLRKPGLLGKLGPRPILKKIPGAGANFAWLAVPASLTKAVKGLDQVSVSAASLTAFRWYRLRRSSGALFSAVATIVGGLLVALGVAWLGTGIGKALLISGAVLTVLAAAVLAISAWRAPVE